MIRNVPVDYPGPCQVAFDTPVALSLRRDVPIAFSREGVVEHFGRGVSGDSLEVSKSCNSVAQTNAAQADLETPSIFLATQRVIVRLTETRAGGSVVNDAIFPPLGPKDRIEAFTVSPNERVVVAVSSNGGSGLPRFLAYDALALSHEAPISTFTSSTIRSSVSALAVDAAGTLFVYDDAGEIVRFESDANPAVKGKIAGSHTLLEPARTPSHGRRPLIVDATGDIIAADDHSVVFFASDADGDAVPRESLSVGDSDDLIDGVGVDSHDFLYVLTHSISSDEAPVITIFGSPADRAATHGTDPLKRDFIDTTTNVLPRSNDADAPHSG